MGRSDRRALAGLALGLGALAVAACNSIAGLDAFTEVDCVSDCGDASLDAPGAATLDDAGDAALDGMGVALDASLADADADAATADETDAPIATSEAGPLRWARWVMPNAAEAGLANAQVLFPGKGPPSGHPANVVVDPTTGLVWDSDSYPATTLAQAQAACAPPERVPSRIELVSIVDDTRSPSIDPAFDAFADGGSTTPRETFWTTSITPGGQPWGVSFDKGQVAAGAAPTRVRCVVVRP